MTVAVQRSVHYKMARKDLKSFQESSLPVMTRCGMLGLSANF